MSNITSTDGSRTRRRGRHRSRALRVVAAGAAAFAGLVTGPAVDASALASETAHHHPHKALAESLSRCKLAATDADLSDGFGSTGSFASSTGTLKATMIFVDFPDAPATDTTASLYDELAPGATRWFDTASYGRLKLEVVAGSNRFFRMPARSDSYGYQRGLTGEEHLQYIHDALRAVGTSVDFSGSQLLYIVPTKAASAISFSPTYMDPVTAGDGTVIGHTVTFGQDMGYWGPKVVNHETGHTMGLPDLYPYEGGTTTQWVGGWDMMGLISGAAPDYFAWHKWKLKWIDDSQVDCVTASRTTSHVLTPLERTGGKKMTVVRTSATRAIVVENRQALGVDTATCAPGVLVYTVDTTVTSGYGPVQVQDARPSSGGCGGEELNDATYGYGSGQVSTFRDPVSGATVTVTGRQGDTYTIAVTK